MSQAQFVPRIHRTSLIVIPARLASTRLPRKMLLRETGKSLVQHTFEAAASAASPSGICVATDDEEIAAEVRSFGGEALLTSPACASGTDRVAEIARQRPDVDIFVNVQGDEPELAGQSIDLVIELLERDPALAMSTLATPIRRREQWLDPACVKVVFDGAAAPCTSAAARSPLSETGMTACSTRSRRISISTWGCTRIGASFFCKLPRCRRRGWSSLRSSNNCGCSTRDTRSPSAWSTSRPLASTRRPTTTHLYVAC